MNRWFNDVFFVNQIIVFLLFLKNSYIVMYTAPIVVHQPQVLNNPIFGPPAQHHFDTVHNYPYIQVYCT